MSKSIYLAAAFAAVVVLTGCEQTATTDTTTANENTAIINAATATTLTIKGNAFSPKELTVKPGDSITVTNNDSVPHTVTANGDEFDTGNIAAGETVTFTAPEEAGEYEYICTVHPSMKGVLVVQE